MAAFPHTVRTLHITKFTLIHIQQSSHRAHQGLNDGKQHKDTDVIAEHPEHEDCHEDLWLGSSSHFEEFLNDTPCTFSTISRRRGSSTEDIVASLVKPKGVGSCCYSFWTEAELWFGCRLIYQRGINFIYYYAIQHTHSHLIPWFIIEILSFILPKPFYHLIPCFIPFYPPNKSLFQNIALALYLISCRNGEV